MVESVCSASVRSFSTMSANMVWRSWRTADLKGSTRSVFPVLDGRDCTLLTSTLVCVRYSVGHFAYLLAAYFEASLLAHVADSPVELLVTPSAGLLGSGRAFLIRLFGSFPLQRSEKFLKSFLHRLAFPRLILLEKSCNIDVVVAAVAILVAAAKEFDEWREHSLVNVVAVSEKTLRGVSAACYLPLCVPKFVRSLNLRR